MMLEEGSSSPRTSTNRPSNTTTPTTTSSSSSQTSRATNNKNNVWYQLYRGWKDATNFPYAIKLFAKSPKAQSIFLSCLLLNGLIFVGSVLVLDYMIYPILNYIINSTTTTTSTTANILDNTTSTINNNNNDNTAMMIHIIKLVYLSVKNIFWIWPLYTLSLILCTFWYNEIAELSYKYSKLLITMRRRRRERSMSLSNAANTATAAAIAASNSNTNTNNSSNSSSSNSNSHSHSSNNNNNNNNNNSSMSSTNSAIASIRKVLVDKITDNIYRSVLLFFFLMQISVLSMLPSPIGSIVSFCMTTWLYAFYAFDYVWTYKNYNTERRLNYFERHWAYMMGFGAPNALASYFFPYFINVGIWAMIFPVFIVFAMLANPPSLNKASSSSRNSFSSRQLPIFYFAVKCMNRLIFFISGSGSSGSAMSSKRK